MNHSRLTRPVFLLLPAVACLLMVAPAKSDSFLLEGLSPLEQADGGSPDVASASLLYAGFSRNAESGVRIYVKATSEVPVERSGTGRRLVYRFVGAKLGNPNSANPLLTEHFGGAVSRAALVPTKGGVNLEIELREAPKGLQGEHHWAVAEGRATLHVEFPTEE